ncbi:MAG TPA: hypothetical protein DEV93_09490 [Chloroflexi bacterium]|nr:hypothetical protein [Chloroflexota bacterium]
MVMPSTRTIEETRGVASSYLVTPTYLQVVSHSHGVAQQLAVIAGLAAAFAITPLRISIHAAVRAQPLKATRYPPRLGPAET